jgi:hypothetical protein
MPLTESGITLNIPDESYFRFQNCRAYQHLSRMSFKEMDVCYFDHSNEITYLIELKDYTTVPEIPSELTSNLILKSKDSLQMVNSFLQNTQYAQGNNNICFPNQFNTNYKKVFLSIIKCNQNHNFHPVHIEYQRLFKAYAKLFDIDTYVVMTYHQARNIYNWIP